LGLPDNGAVIMTTFFFIVMGLIILAGLVYDKGLKLWVYQRTVAVERSEYTHGKLAPSIILKLMKYDLPMMIALKQEEAAADLRKWIFINILDKDNTKTVSFVLKKYANETIEDAMRIAGFEESDIKRFREVVANE